MVRVSAPGKVHLIGEHAVVYGHPAIIAAIGKRIYIEAEKSDKIIFTDARFNKKLEWTVDEAREAVSNARDLWKRCSVGGSFSELLEWAKDSGHYGNYWKSLIGTCLEMSKANGGISILIEKCEIPTGSGLGSSSAAAVAIAKAVCEVYRNKTSLEEVNAIAYECEKLVHGNPSGGDNTACCFGGLVWFQKTQPKNIVKPLKDLQNLENFVLVYVKEPEKNTGELIQMVKNIPESERVPKMREIEKMTHEMLEVMKKKDTNRMKEIINETNRILSSFGLSIDETEEIYDKIKDMGGAAKMCGACYGGVMLAWHEEPEKIIKTIKDLGFEPFETDLAVEGVRIED